MLIEINIKVLCGQSSTFVKFIKGVVVMSFPTQSTFGDKNK